MNNLGKWKTATQMARAPAHPAPAPAPNPSLRPALAQRSPLSRALCRPLRPRLAVPSSLQIAISMLLLTRDNAAGPFFGAQSLSLLHPPPALPSFNARKAAQPLTRSPAGVLLTFPALVRPQAWRRWRVQCCFGRRRSSPLSPSGCT